MLQLIVIICILLVTVYALKRPQDSKLNLPPLVHYNIPVFGHTFSYMFNAEEFFLKCKEEYGDIFRIYVWGHVKTIVGREHYQEVLSRNDVFDFGLAFKHIFPRELEFLVVSVSRETIRLLRDNMFNKLVFYTSRMQERIHFAMEKYIGNESRTFYNVSNVITQIIAVPIASIFVSMEVSEFDDIITTFAEFTVDIAKIIGMPPIFDLIYPGFQQYVNTFVIKYKIVDPISKHQKILLKHIKDQTQKRLQEKQKHGDSWVRPNDLLQDFLESDWIDMDNIDYNLIVNKIISFIFVSVHSTARSCANAVIDLASHPECMQELYEEQLEVHKKADENGILPYESLNEMKKLDSLVKESLRLTGHIASLPHRALSDYTFSDGIQVPEGKVVEVYNDDINRDESLHGANPREFDPFRYADKNDTASKISKGYVLFGGGKRTCPGRYFAVNEMKFFLHNLILKYNIRTESGKVENKLRLGSMSIPSRAGIVFEKRI